MKPNKPPSRAVNMLDPVWITLADGCRLAARIWLPTDAEATPVPAILEYIPYRRRDFTAIGNSKFHRYFAEHGYAVVQVDIRGSGDSDGIMADEYLQQELDDGVEIIAWMARQPWCTGNVGMMGISWGGFNALQVAALRPPALKAIITACSTDDRYADDVHYMGGCLLTDNLMWGATMFAFNSRSPDPAVVGKRWREMWLERLERNDPWIISWLSHQHRDQFWKHGSVCEDFSAITCAVFAVGGWADGYSSAIPRLLEGLSCPRKGLVGPWAHAYPHAGRPGPAIGFLQEGLRFWDHWLKGQDTGFMDEPAYRVWMQESVPPKPQYENREGRWVAEDRWPASDIEWRRYALNPGRIEDRAQPPAEILHESPQTVGLAAGEWCAYGYDAEMPTDQRFDDAGSVVFDTAPLDQRCEILGAPTVALELSVDRPLGFLAVRLNDVSPGGASTRVTYGLLNLTHRDGHEAGKPLVPGKRYRISVKLNDIAHAFPAGHRIRVAVSTCYWPLVWPSPEPVRLTIVTGDSSLELPVRAPRAEDEKLRAFDPPEASQPIAHIPLVPYQRGRTVWRDVASGETIVEAVKNRGRFHLPDTKVTYAGKGVDRYIIRDDAPLSARMESSYTIDLEGEQWSTRTETRTVMTSTATEFLVSATLDAYEAGTRIFTKTWDARILRDMI
ncbi:MAG: uncharacterized protein QOK29_279 [Rhodospirillaceae bacterium]|nr:uncharacterized protein [Rhodospirillaceae bacterium]